MNYVELLNYGSIIVELLPQSGMMADYMDELFAKIAYEVDDIETSMKLLEIVCLNQTIKMACANVQARAKLEELRLKLI